jgi:hypothetical protein
MPKNESPEPSSSANENTNDTPSLAEFEKKLSDIFDTHLSTATTLIKNKLKKFPKITPPINTISETTHLFDPDILIPALSRNTQSNQFSPFSFSFAKLRQARNCLFSAFGNIAIYRKTLFCNSPIPPPLPSKKEKKEDKGKDKDKGKNKDKKIEPEIKPKTDTLSSIPSQKETTTLQNNVIPPPQKGTLLSTSDTLTLHTQRNYIDRSPKLKSTKEKDIDKRFKLRQQKIQNLIDKKGNMT